MISVACINNIEDRRICMFIRHGEKEQGGFSLTEKGKADISNFARTLASLSIPIIVYSSPESRCAQTASIICNILQNSDKEIHFSTILGKPGIQVKNEKLYSSLTDTMKCRDIFTSWKKGNFLEEMHSPNYIKSAMEDYFRSISKENSITLCISQSGTVACTGYALGLVDYQNTENGWVDYLDGYIYEAR